MSLRPRKLIVLTVLASILLLANAHAIACWLDRIGLIGWAQDLRAEYVTGTAIIITARTRDNLFIALLLLVSSGSFFNRTAEAATPHPTIG